MRFAFDIKKVNIVNLNGVDLKKRFEEQSDISFEKMVGNLLYENSTDIDFEEKARAIHRGERVEFTEREKDMFEVCVKDKYIPLVERRILEQLVEVKD